MAMSMRALCDKCETLNKEFNTSARQMNGRELAAFRRRMMMKHNAGFVNGWTVRICQHVEDVFTVARVQSWEQTEKKPFGKSKTLTKQRLTLQSDALPDAELIGTAVTQEIPANGSQIRVKGELELVLFLHPDGLQVKSAQFLKNVKLLPR